MEGRIRPAAPWGIVSTQGIGRALEVCPGRYMKDVHCTDVGPTTNASMIS